MTTPPAPQAGEIWDALLNPVVGHEQGGSPSNGRRPVLVISSDLYNRMPHELCIIVPLTRTDRGLVTQLRIDPPSGGLTSHTVIMCDQPRTISPTRLKKRRGSVAPETLRRARLLVGKFLDLHR